MVKAGRPRRGNGTAKKAAKFATKNSAKPTKPKKCPVAIVPLSSDQVAFIEAEKSRRHAVTTSRLFKDETRGEDVIAVPDMGNPQFFMARLTHATGSANEAAAIHLSEPLWNLASRWNKKSPSLVVDAAFALLDEIGPRDGLEGMMATQMVAVHQTAMIMLQKHAASPDLDYEEHYLRHAERLLRLFTLQTDALNRHRGRGPSEQRVTVEHVHVHEGGQAVVGNVTTTTPGRGGNAEST